MSSGKVNDGYIIHTSTWIHAREHCRLRQARPLKPGPCRVALNGATSQQKAEHQLPVTSGVSSDNATLTAA